MNKRQSNTWLLIATLFAFAVVFCMLPYLFTQPGHIVLNNGGDAGKNYYTFIYHCLYGKGIWFDGMNYPFGEHITYTDAMPVFSVPVTYLRGIFPVSINFALTLIHLSMALAYILAIVFSYKILVSYKVKPMPAMLFAALLIIMTPQVDRIYGHFALSHACFLPMFIYWVIQYMRQHKLKFILYLFLLNLFYLFLHPYYVAIALVFSGFYCLGYLLFVGGNIVAKLKQVLPVIAVPLAAIIILKVFMIITDPVTDRPEMPAGTMATITENTDIFYSPNSPLSTYLHDKIKIGKQPRLAEGSAYVGVSALLITFVSIVVLLVRRFAKRKNDESNTLAPVETPGVWLTVAAGSLLLARGIPFIWNPDLLNDLSVFRQFRSLGRFSNIYYYVVCLYAVVVLYKWHVYALSKGKRILAYAVLLISAGLWGFEAKGNIDYCKRSDKDLTGLYDFFFSPQPASWNDFFKDQKLKPSDFQSIITLRYTNVGSEKIWVNAENSWNMVLAYKASMELQLPINDVMMSRTSWSQTREQVRIAAGPWSDKSILDRCNNKPFLLLVFAGLPVDRDQAYLIQASDLLGGLFGFYAYACYPERIRANDKANYEQVRGICETMAVGDTCAMGDNTNWFVQHFDTYTCDTTILGDGAFAKQPAVDTVIAEMSMHITKDNELFEFSCWAYLDTISYKSPNFVIEKLDSTGTVIGSENILTAESTDNHGNWYRAGSYFNIPIGCTKLRVRLIQKEKDVYLAIDELQIRGAEQVIISKSKNGAIMINNHLQRKR